MTASDAGTRWDTEHKRDEDRADTQHALDNTRWDTQHALGNTRWDTEHKRDGDRADTQHSLDNTRWDTQHALDNTRWDTYLALKHSRENQALANEWTLFAAVHAGYISVAQSSLDRAIQRGTYITTAAGAVATLYTGLLGLRFTANHPDLPARSVIPALFLGGAVAFSAFYLSFLRARTKVSEFLPSGLGGTVIQTRLLAFMEWTFAGVLARAWSLRLAVVALALGISLLPIGFVQLNTNTTSILGWTATSILALWILGEIVVALVPGLRPNLAPAAEPLPGEPAVKSPSRADSFASPEPPPPPPVAENQDPPVPPQPPAAAGTQDPPPQQPSVAPQNPPPPPPVAENQDPPVPPAPLPPLAAESRPADSAPAPAAPIDVVVHIGPGHPEDDQ